MKDVYCLQYVAFLLFAGLFLLAASEEPRFFGGYRPIENINDPHVTEIAEFAVSEYNRQFQKKLVFQSVIRGETQVVTGVNYKLVIAVKDGSSLPVSTANYECVVWEKVWMNFRKLTLFHAVSD